MTWKKYQHLFSGGNYLFLFEEGHEKDLCEITLINKSAFHKIFNDHKYKFVEAFGSDINSEKLLNLIVEKKSLSNTRLETREDLIGILLGYGKMNAELFQKRKKIGIFEIIKKTKND